MTALMAAAALGDVELVGSLLSGGADVGVTRGPKAAGATALAAYHHRSDSVQFFDRILVEEGASLALPRTPCCPRGHFLERLASTRCNRQPVCDGCGKSDIHRAGIFWTCWACDHDLCLTCSKVVPMAVLPSSAAGAIERLLPGGEAALQQLVESTDLCGWQALHYAAASGHQAVVQALLAAKAPATAADSAGRGPLHWAAWAGQPQVIEQLLQDGSPAVTDVRGRAPLALIPPEVLRYAYAEEEAGLQEAMADHLMVSGAGDAAGLYLRAASAQQQAPVRNSSTGADEATAAAAPTLATAEGGTSSSSLPRPHYIRADDAQFSLAWRDGQGWELLRQNEALYRSSCSSLHCPTAGWEACAGANDSAPLSVADAQPWQTGSRLLLATPAELRPEHLRSAVAALPTRSPPLPQGASMMVTVPGGLARFNMGSLPIARLPGMLGSPLGPLGAAGGMGPLLLEEMIRSGALPALPSDASQECRQQ